MQASGSAWIQCNKGKRLLSFGSKELPHGEIAINMFNNMFAGKKVLVTGNTGFKGSWFLVIYTVWSVPYGYSIGIPTVPSL